MRALSPGMTREAVERRIGARGQEVDLLYREAGKDFVLGREAATCIAFRSGSGLLGNDDLLIIFDERGGLVSVWYPFYPRLPGR